MELIVFDLDGTLLNASSELSTYTRETLHKLTDAGILYTIATGRTLHASKEVLDSHRFRLPLAFKNGVAIWNPEASVYTQHTHLTLTEIEHVVTAVLAQNITPFLFTIEPGNRHAIYHPPLHTEIERKLVMNFYERPGVTIHPAGDMPADAEISNISAVGPVHAVEAIEMLVANEPGLVAYAGIAQEAEDLKWIDIHHVDATKGSAVQTLRDELGASSIVCFGDSDNDLPMFEAADEAYAPSNAKPELLEAATAVIGHHDEDGIARFLRERFNLD